MSRVINPGGHLLSAGEVAAWRARMPAAFGPSLAARLWRWLGAAGFVAWLVGTLWWFDVSPQRLLNGLNGLGVIVRWPSGCSPDAIILTCKTRQGPACTTVTGMQVPSSRKIWVMPSFLPRMPRVIDRGRVRAV